MTLLYYDPRYLDHQTGQHPERPERLRQIVARLEQSGVIKAYVAVLDQAALGLPVDAFVEVRLTREGKDEVAEFESKVHGYPEVMQCWMLSGGADYLLRVVVPDIAAYDTFYKKLISRIAISKVSSAFAMEQIKYTTALPLDFAIRRDEREWEKMAVKQRA